MPGPGIGTGIAIGPMMGSTSMPNAMDVLRSFGSIEMLIDSIDGTTNNGTNVTSVTDLSGKGRTVNLVTAPLGSNTQWNGTQKGMRFTAAGLHQLSFATPLIAVAGMTTIMVIGNASAPGVDTGPFIGGGGGNITMRLKAAGTFAMLAGVVELVSTFTTANSTRFIWICVFNGATSIIARSGSEQTGATTATPTLNATTHFISQTNLTADVAAFALYSKVLSATERAQAISALANRYSGCTLV